ncbi:uclacyanin-2-like [Dioscorea cayenensis subsp. rotundata]|uniref:Uclacyanin-2-like n=1 Tax=Dioscorea cayennensis subsp. rotundata TaxID=55577 RepID=A0AB40CS19_DIOCR|nr:uclacyanin-2-like [Dioscorea cayenensis subsp. rotundata]
MLVFVCVLLVVVPVYSVNYGIDWSQGVNYDTWGSEKTINVGDTLEFKYGASHSVVEVSSDYYNACSYSNTDQVHTDMDTTITLSTPGTHYFICGTPGHCSGGMKLAVSVSGSSSGSPLTPSPPAGDGSNNSPTPPSSSSSPPTNNSSSPASPAKKNGGAMLRVDAAFG